MADGITRREFLKGTGAVITGAAVLDAGLSPAGARAAAAPGEAAADSAPREIVLDVNGVRPRAARGTRGGARSLNMDAQRPVTRREVNAALLAAGAMAALPTAAFAQQTKTLPAPRKEIGKPLMQALQLRRSIREYAERPLPAQLLSELLWAAYGVNRPSGDRTAPSWRHIMVIDVYAAMADGVWLYEPTQHALRLHLKTDIRAQTGMQDFVAGAPLNLVYVVHGERMHGVSLEDRRLYGSVDAAFAGQNVYLYCASEGLATVFRGAVDYAKLGRAMRLGEGQFVAFAQTVGYPRNRARA